MLREDFDKWLITLIANDILDGLWMHVISLGYLENRPPWFVEFLNVGTEEENKQLMGLDKQVFLSNNKQEPALDDSDVERIRKKKAKAKK